MTTTETRVTIPEDAFQDTLLRFVQDSPLRFCTTHETRGTGALVVELTRDYDVLSSGEKRVWLLLVDMVDGSLHWLTSYGDDRTRRAIVNVITGLMSDDAGQVTR